MFVPDDKTCPIPTDRLENFRRTVIIRGDRSNEDITEESQAQQAPTAKSLAGTSLDRRSLVQGATWNNNTKPRKSRTTKRGAKHRGLVAQTPGPHTNINNNNNNNSRSSSRRDSVNKTQSHWQITRTTTCTGADNGNKRSASITSTTNPRLLGEGRTVLEESTRASANRAIQARSIATRAKLHKAQQQQDILSQTHEWTTRIPN